MCSAVMVTFPPSPSASRLLTFPPSPSRFLTFRLVTFPPSPSTSHLMTFLPSPSCLVTFPPCDLPAFPLPPPDLTASCTAPRPQQREPG